MRVKQNLVFSWISLKSALSNAECVQINFGVSPSRHLLDKSKKSKNDHWNKYDVNCNIPKTRNKEKINLRLILMEPSILNVEVLER